MKEKLTMASIAKIDGGRIGQAIERELERALDDCRDRPRLEKPRKVNVTIALTPYPDDAGDELAGVDVSFAIKQTGPARESRRFNMRAEADGLVFNDLSPDDARQGTIDELTEPEAGEKPQMRRVAT